MKNYFEEIRKKLNQEIEIESIEIVDNSKKHRGHKFYSSEKFHLHLKIKFHQKIRFLKRNYSNRTRFDGNTIVTPCYLSRNPNCNSDTNISWT